MKKEAKSLLDRVKKELWEMYFKEDRFSHQPKIRTFSSQDIEDDIYFLIRISDDEEEAKFYIKTLVELFGQFYEFPPEKKGEYYPFRYIAKQKKLGKTKF
jgi:hypothetical protein